MIIPPEGVSLPIQCSVVGKNNKDTSFFNLPVQCEYKIANTENKDTRFNIIQEIMKIPGSLLTLLKCISKLQIQRIKIPGSISALVV